MLGLGKLIGEKSDGDVYLRLDTSWRKISWGVYLRLDIEGSRPEWSISSMIYNRDTPFWSGALDI